MFGWLDGYEEVNWFIDQIKVAMAIKGRKVATAM